MELPRRGDEIIVCGRLFHTGAPVVLWTDPGGYDAYRVERRFARPDEAAWEQSAGAIRTPNRFGMPTAGLTEAEVERLRGGGWDLPTLQRVVDQFVIHYDVCGTSRTCFRVLHDVRGLSVHFMIDIDGTIYQTLDVKEKAWHATVANDRSVGVELANIGAYPTRTGVTPVPPEKDPLDKWYARDASGAVRLNVPAELDGGGVRTAGFVGQPARAEIVVGTVQGQELRQWDFTPEQYDSLTKLAATLSGVLPRIRLDWPRDEHGGAITQKLSDDQFAAYTGLIGHYHVQANKTDPGPAFQWQRVIEGAAALKR